MINGIQQIMICVYTLVAFISVTAAIRIDWNTNTGPIIPPTSTIPPEPKRPFRSPAPVWEDQTDDIPNPNPYRYVAPPPSRPRLANDNYVRAQQQLQQQQQQQHFGQLITKYSNNNNNNNDNNNNFYYKTVPSLAVQYIPNFGFKYNAIVPSSSSAAGKLYYLKENEIYDEKFNGKLNGRYNAKLKKYKAYEKLKFLPQPNYPTSFQYQYFPQPQPQQPQLQQQQQLPFPQQQTQFRSLQQPNRDQEFGSSTQQTFRKQIPPQKQQLPPTSPLAETKPQQFPQQYNPQQFSTTTIRTTTAGAITSPVPQTINSYNSQIGGSTKSTSII